MFINYVYIMNRSIPQILNNFYKNLNFLFKIIINDLKFVLNNISIFYKSSFIIIFLILLFLLYPFIIFTFIITLFLLYFIFF